MCELYIRVWGQVGRGEARSWMGTWLCVSVSFPLCIMLLMSAEWWERILSNDFLSCLLFDCLRGQDYKPRKVATCVQGTLSPSMMHVNRPFCNWIQWCFVCTVNALNHYKGPTMQADFMARLGSSTKIIPWDSLLFIMFCSYLPLAAQMRKTSTIYLKEKRSPACMCSLCVCSPIVTAEGLQLKTNICCG